MRHVFGVMLLEDTVATALFNHQDSGPSQCSTRCSKWALVIRKTDSWDLKRKENNC